MLSIKRNISNIAKRSFSQKTFHIYKYNSCTPNEFQECKKYTIDAEESGKMMIDVLMDLKKIDIPCKEGICGSCALKINGAHTLGCLCYLDDIPNNSRIYPLANIDIKNLVLDMIHSQKNFTKMLQRIEDDSISREGWYALKFVGYMYIGIYFFKGWLSPY